ncbi:electron transfer flavoprotein subunit beta [Candidatus Falkowbacteria bacterium RIFCSPLOWO2_12_FULL_45_13]|uniref:Electron transfer flavoprotein subunit beta n=1 Tax=Candidatus Falkowbacteria bacterium RIFCSPLOWO2_12_FULL_45_13 TaxID=1797991 RepID=A0A1F5SXG3_9BACT|nr:MAG: electron transfer flavoprotein subunit beta [Candidatus Falkowbacteria bacterium RIFCSPLOWO2_12_FULL_45_13]
MKIVVCIKQVPDTTDVKIDPVTNTLIREGVPSIPNPYDMHALEMALEIKDRYGAEVIVVSMGPPQARAVLKKAISLGADEAILLTDRAFAGADTWATSYALAGAIAKINPDIVFCGKQAIDGDTAQVGPGIATRLNFSQLTYVSDFKSVDVEKHEITVVRKLEEGVETVAARLPALLTVLKEANEIRYASLPNLMKSVKYEPPIWDNKIIGLDANLLGLKGSPTQVVKIFSPPLREGGKLITASEAEIKKIVGQLMPQIRSEASCAV